MSSPCPGHTWTVSWPLRTNEGCSMATHGAGRGTELQPEQCRLASRTESLASFLPGNDARSQELNKSQPHRRSGRGGIKLLIRCKLQAREATQRSMFSAGSRILVQFPEPHFLPRTAPSGSKHGAGNSSPQLKPNQQIKLQPHQCPHCGPAPHW